MKKLIVFGFLAITTLFAVVAMSKEPNGDVVTGTVAYYGNAPFVTLGIKAEDKKIYYLEIGKHCSVVGENGKKRVATEKDFSKLQGEKIEFIGKILKDENNINLLNAPTFVVEAYNVQKSN